MRHMIYNDIAVDPRMPSVILDLSPTERIGIYIAIGLLIIVLAVASVILYKVINKKKNQSDKDIEEKEN